MYSAWFNHTTFAGGAFVPPSCCVLLNDDPRRPLYRDETQCQIEALLSANATFGDDANVKTRGCYDAVVAWLRRYEYLSSYAYVSIVLQVRIGRQCAHTGVATVTLYTQNPDCCNLIRDENFHHLLRRYAREIL